MKKLLCLVCMGMALTVHSQGSIKDIYLTAQDYSQNKLSFASEGGLLRHKIKLNDFCAKGYITFFHQNSVYQFYKSQMFGYKTNEGHVVLFLNRKELVLLNAGEPVLIYKHIVSKPPVGKTNVTNYYFSKDASSLAQLLTFSNLKQVFPNANGFHQQLSSLFRYNTELASYDEMHKMYRLSWIYQSTLSN